MNKAKKTTASTILALLLTTFLSSSIFLTSSVRAAEKSQDLLPDNLKEEFAYSLGVQAYVYAYPLVHTNLFRWMWHEESSPRYVGPANRLNHFRELMDDKSTVAATPNNDTLYTLAFLDLRESPVIIDVPAMGERYYTIQLADMYASNFGVIGTRATGSAGGKYLVVPPGWKGTKPEGVSMVFHSPTPWTMALLRILVDGDSDLPEVNKLQDKFHLLTMDGKALPPYKKSIADLPSDKKPLDVWRVINRELTDNPPIAAHSSFVEQFATIGIKPGGAQELSSLDEATQRGLARAATAGKEMVDAMAADISGKNINGWGYPHSSIGRYGNDFAYRAAVTRMGLMANDPEEAVYMSSYADKDGVVLDGKKHYVLHFDADNLPPAKAFWSNTMYDLGNYGFTSNILNRYSVGDRTESLKYNDDGSLDIYIGPTARDESEMSNWLPTPEGPFYMFLRIYLPEDGVIEQSWVPPEVTPRP